MTDRLRWEFIQQGMCIIFIYICISPFTMTNMNWGLFKGRCETCLNQAEKQFPEFLLKSSCFPAVSHRKLPAWSRHDEGCNSQMGAGGCGTRGAFPLVFGRSMYMVASPFDRKDGPKPAFMMLVLFLSSTGWMNNASNKLRDCTS